LKAYSNLLDFLVLLPLMSFSVCFLFWYVHSTIGYNDPLS
jgi:hypothetical protein